MKKQNQIITEREVNVLVKYWETSVKYNFMQQIIMIAYARSAIFASKCFEALLDIELTEKEEDYADSAREVISSEELRRVLSLKFYEE